jgi:hypothetical protein
MAGSALLPQACFDGTDGLEAGRRQGWGSPVEGVAPSVTCGDVPVTHGAGALGKRADTDPLYFAKNPRYFTHEYEGWEFPQASCAKTRRDVTI